MIDYLTEEDFDEENSKLAKKFGYKRHFYLERLGIPLEHCGTNFIDKRDRRNWRFELQRRKYGFDERETWNMDGSFVQWLYERLMMFKELATDKVDLEYHKITIDNIEYTLEECIDNIIELLEEVLVTNNDDSEMYYRNVRKALKIFREIIFLLWW